MRQRFTKHVGEKFHEDGKARAFAGSSIRLLFEINSLYEESWHIDNLEIR